MEALPPLSAWASMSSQLQGSIFLVFGLVSIAFSEYFGGRASEVQRRLFGVEFTPRFLRLGYLFGGIVFCVVGGLALVGLVEFRP